MQKRSLVPMTTVTATLCLLLCYSLHMAARSPKHRIAFMQTPTDITIRGQVTDSETGTPLPGAQVRLKGTGKGAASDGNYTLAGMSVFGQLNDAGAFTNHYNGLLKVRVSVNADPLYVYITNLGITDADRLSQVQEAMAVIDPRNYTWKVFTGTFNATPGSAPINTVLTSFTDVFSGQAAYTYPADTPTSRVDYIFLKNTIAFSNRRVINSQGSTHRPIVCDIEMTQ